MNHCISLTQTNLLFKGKEIYIYPMVKTGKWTRLACYRQCTVIRQITVVQKAVIKALSVHLQEGGNPALQLPGSAA